MASDLPFRAETPPEDLSGSLLSQVLGEGWDAIAGGELSSSAATLAHDVLATFNWVALAFVSALFVLTIVQGVASGAAEGTPLGRGRSALWTPLRFALALSFLAPVVKGLSLFQAFMLLAIGYSVNMANYVWDGGLAFFVESGGRISLKAPQNLAEDGEELGRGILKALTVQDYYADRLDLPLEGPIATESFFPTALNVEGQYILTFSVPPGSSLRPGDLGRVRIPCADPGEKLCAARVSAVRGLIGELMDLSAALADPRASLAPADGALLARAVQNYALAVEPYLAMESGAEEERLARDLSEFKDSASRGGWMTAGAYYWTISRLNERSRASLYQRVSFGEGVGWENARGEALDDFETVVSRYNRYASGAFSPERASGAGAIPAEFPSYAWFMDKLSGALGRYGLNKLLSELRDGDPVATLASLGNFLIGASETVIGLRVTAYGLARAVGESSESLLGQVVSLFTGSVSSFVAGVAQGAVLGLGPYILIISVLLISYGFFLAYFLPALPFLLWIGGVLGWLVLVMESLVAAPLWIAAHALPEGDGLAGVAGRKGYGLFLGVLLRPPLMVFGFLLAMALLNGVGRAIGGVFAAFGFSFLSESFLGVSGFLAFAAILGICVVTATWKLFGLMSHLPNRVVNWIGERIHPVGEKEDARSMGASYREAGALSTRAINPVTRVERAARP
ncbi:MAG: DotA/TraY family protein [Deltaproteobacteria bacterium]|jgi:hypothetical protein|nr:DotA/TraY family protein [Deltaproteobacteria bacterium]